MTPQPMRDDVVMVPREPTPQMVEAGWKHVNRQLMNGHRDAIQALYRAMIAAAPAIASPAAAQDVVAIVNEQADDERLWFIPVYATEAILQQALRRLHAAIEGKTPDECARAALQAAREKGV